MRVAGVDGCASGWVAVLCDDGPASARLVPVARVADLLDAEAPDLAVVDIPIGLTDGPHPRDAEPAMRAMLPGKASSVFSTPVRAALAAPTYREASDLNRAALGVGLSKQTHAIMPRIAELDALVRERGQGRVREGHPEVSFALLAGYPVLSRKREAAGQEDRRALLERAGFPVGRLLASAQKPFRGGADDILDACALAWTALRVLEGTHLTLPAAPSRDGAGLEISVVA